MNVSDLLRKLSFNELSNLSLSNSGNGTIVEGKIPALIDMMNDGLLRLYGTFCMNQKDLLLETIAHISSYELSPKFAWSNRDNGETYHYIMDHAEPFIGDLVKILTVYSTDGRDVPLNDTNRIDSVFTPVPSVLQIPHPDMWQTVGVQYQASHPKLTGINDEIILPLTLEEALRAYVAYKVFSGMGGQENSAKAAEHMSVYEAICSGVVDKDLVNTSITSTNHKFYQRGWK